MRKDTEQLTVLSQGKKDRTGHKEAKWNVSSAEKKATEQLIVPIQTKMEAVIAQEEEIIQEVEAEAKKKSLQGREIITVAGGAVMMRVVTQEKEAGKQTKLLLVLGEILMIVGGNQVPHGVIVAQRAKIKLGAQLQEIGELQALRLQLMILGVLPQSQIQK